MIRAAAIILFAGLMCLVGSCKKEDALKNIDQKALFVPPSAFELQTIKAGWENRNLTPQNITVEATQSISSKLSFHLLSFRLQGVKQYAGALVPIATTPLPVLVYLYGFALTDPVSYQNIRLLSSDTTLPFVYVIPSLKGQSLSLTVNDRTYKNPLSEGTRNNAFDGATDDAIATLNALAKTFKQADTTRVIAREEAAEEQWPC